MNTTEEQIVRLPLECRLTDAELKAFSKELADALNKKAQVENQLETFKAQKKAEVSALDATIARNTVFVNSEKEFRLVECRVEYDFTGKGIKAYFRLDNGELVKTDPITNEERQTMMPHSAE
jgi:hypothetical protein